MIMVFATFSYEVCQFFRLVYSSFKIENVHASGDYIKQGLELFVAKQKENNYVNKKVKYRKIAYIDIDY